MTFDNEYLFARDLPEKAKNGWVYLIVTNAKELYVCRQTGARSWDAMNTDFSADVAIVHGSRNDILEKCRNELDVHYILSVENKIELRKAVMDFQAVGTIGDYSMDVEWRKR